MAQTPQDNTTITITIGTNGSTVNISLSEIPTFFKEFYELLANPSNDYDYNKLAIKIKEALELKENTENKLKDFLEKLGKLGTSTNTTNNDIIDDIKKSIADLMDVDKNKISINEDELKDKLKNACSCDQDNCAKSFGEFLGALKSIRDKIKGGGRVKKLYFFLDTCYDENRGGELARGLMALRSNNSGCNAIALLAAAYATMLSNPKSIDRLEWIPLLARAVAKSQDSRAYIPVCPSKGDLVAVVYYLIICCRGSGGSGGGAGTGGG